MEYRSNTCEEESMQDIPAEVDIYADDKKRLWLSLRAYLPVSIVTAACTYFLEYTRTPDLHLITGSMFTWFWAYGIHRLHHSIPSTGIFYYLNPHMSIHHSHVKILPRWLELTVETLHNSVWFFLLYLLQEVTDLHLVPNSIILMAMLVYSTVHVINYTMFGSEKHKEQHRNPDVNYGPDFLDHVFGSNSTEEFEDMSHFIPNSILSALAIRYMIDQSLIK